MNDTYYHGHFHYIHLNQFAMYNSTSHWSLEVEISVNSICGEEPWVNDLAIDWFLRDEETNLLQVRWHITLLRLSKATPWKSRILIIVAAKVFKISESFHLTNDWLNQRKFIVANPRKGRKDFHCYKKNATDLVIYVYGTRRNGCPLIEKNCT